MATNRIKVLAFKGLIGISFVVGIQGKKGESSIVLMEAGEDHLQIRHYGEMDGSRYTTNIEYFKEAHLENGERQLSCRAFKDSEAPHLRRLSQFVSTEDTDMDEDVLYEFIYALKSIKKYPQTGSRKSQFVQHLQHHNINRTSFNVPEPKEKSQAEEVDSEYTAWGTW